MSLSEADEKNTHPNPKPPAGSGPSKSREEDAIYQGGRVVARVLGAQVDSIAREIRFNEIYNSTDLLLPEDCEFRNYRILIQRLDFAAREEGGGIYKGRVLKGVVAEILGHREQ